MASVALAQDAPLEQNQASQDQTTSQNTEVSGAQAETGEQPEVVDQGQPASQPATLDTEAQVRVINLVANVSNRMDATAARLQDILIRIASRTDKLEAAGLDTTTVTPILINAQNSADEAQVLLLQMDTLAVSLIESEDPDVAWNELKIVVDGIKTTLGATYVDLNLAVQELKNIVRAADTQSSAQVMDASQTNSEEVTNGITSDAAVTGQ